MKKILYKTIFMFSLFTVGYLTMSVKDGGGIGSGGGGTSVTCYDEFKITDLEFKAWCLDCRVKRGSEFKLESHCNR